MGLQLDCDVSRDELLSRWVCRRGVYLLFIIYSAVLRWLCCFILVICFWSLHIEWARPPPPHTRTPRVGLRALLSPSVHQL